MTPLRHPSNLHQMWLSRTGNPVEKKTRDLVRRDTDKYINTLAEADEADHTKPSNKEAS